MTARDERRIGMGVRARIAGACLFLGILALSICLYSLHVGVFVDDVFIYLRVADNIAEGTGPVLNPGDRHFPVTSPLWVFLLASLKKLFGGADMVLLSKIASVVFLAAASLPAFLLLRRFAGHWAALAPMPIFFNFVAVTSAGGEIALAYFCLFGTFWSYFSRRDFLLTGAAAAAGYLARPELALIVPVIALHYLVQWKREDGTVRTLIVDWGKLALAFLFVAAVWHAYYAVRFHSLFPGTLKAKITQGRSGKWPLYADENWPLARGIFSGQYGLVVSLLFGLFYFRGISLSLLLYTAAHYHAYKLLTVPYYHWYFYDLFLLIPVFTIFGTIALVRFIGRAIESRAAKARPDRGFPARLRAAGRILILISAAYCILITTKIRSLPSYQTESRLESYRHIAAAIEPEIRKGDVLLAPEIGILGYYLEDAVIRDVNGIGSPDASLENINNLEYFVSAYAPRFIFFPAFMKQTDPLIRFTAKDGEPLVYRLTYPDIDVSRPVDCVFRLVSPNER